MTIPPPPPAWGGNRRPTAAAAAFSLSGVAIITIVNTTGTNISCSFAGAILGPVAGRYRQVLGPACSRYLGGTIIIILLLLPLPSLLRHSVTVAGPPPGVVSSHSPRCLGLINSETTEERNAAGAVKFPLAIHRRYYYRNVTTIAFHP